MRFYHRKLRDVLLIGFGVSRDTDRLQRLYICRRVFIIVGPYEFGIEKKSDMKTNKGGK